MLEILLLSALIAHGLVVALRLRGMARRDSVLFRFCEIRRRLVAHIYRRDIAGEMRRGEYLSARRLLTTLNAIVGEYDRARAQVFNYREFVRILRSYGEISGELESIPPPQDPELRALYEDASRALVLAFFAHTPFLMTEMVLQTFFKEQAAGYARALRDAERFGVKVGLFGRAASV